MKKTKQTYSGKIEPPSFGPEEPNGLSKLLREARWMIFSVLSVYLILSLVTYSKLDPGWSRVSDVTTIQNLCGKFGAWISDLLLFSFGASAWWLCIPLVRFVWTEYKKTSAKAAEKVKAAVAHRHEASIRTLGFVLLFLGSMGIERLRLYSLKMSLPRTPGGVVGEILGVSASTPFGYTGATMLFFLLFAVGVSLYFHCSWLNAAERIGESVEETVTSIARYFATRRDRKIGQASAEKRDGVLKQVREKISDVMPEASQPITIAAPRPAAHVEPTFGEQVETVAFKEVAARKSANQKVAESMPEMAPVYADADQEMEDQVEEEEFSEPVARTERPAQAAEAPIKIVQQTTSIPRAEAAEKARQGTQFGSLPETNLPPLSLLDDAPPVQESISHEVLESTSRLIERKLQDFGVTVKVVEASPGPVITRYEIEPASGVKGSQIVNLARDLARALSLSSIRVVEVIPGKNFMGLELPNKKRQIVRLTEILGSKAYNDGASYLTIALGKDISGNAVVADLAKMPHLLVAGTTGSGKSVGINATILSLLYKADPNDVRMILIDPKMLELSIYEGIPHLLSPVVTDMQQAGHALNWSVNEMERRYKLMAKLGVRNLAGYNAKIAEAKSREEFIPNPFSLTPDAPEPLDKLPHIVIIIDELADLMMVVGKKVEELIARIAQKARAAGIHLILATQRPSVDVITGLIKANIPTRIAFQVSSKIDSRTILDQMGAESLLGMGDMLYMPPGSGFPTRVHGAFVSDEEVHRVVEHLKAQGEPNYIEGILEAATPEGGAEGAGDGARGGEESDAMYDEAVQVVLKHRRASISLVQRHLRIGYNRAARLLEQMEQNGMVSTMGSNGNREILVPASGTE